MHSINRRKTATLVVAALTVAVLSACSSAGASPDPGASGGLVIKGETIADAKLWKAAQADGSFDLYSSDPRTQGIIDAFKKDTGITVNLTTVTGSEMIERIRSEYGAKSIPADVAMISDPVQTQALLADGIFSPYCPVGWKAIPAKLKDPKCGWWVGVQPIYTIVYNTAVLKAKDAPKSWADLLNPKWKGKITLPWIGNGGSTWSRDLFLRTKFGEKYWTKLAANKPTIVSSSNQSLDNVARGEYPVGLTVGGNIALAVQDGQPVKAVIPSDGVPAYSVTVGLINGAKQKAAAQVFLSWLSSKAGQTAVGQTGDYPVRADVPGPINGDGGNLPSAGKAGLEYPETYPDYASVRTEWIDQWLSTFHYNP